MPSPAAPSPIELAQSLERERAAAMLNNDQVALGRLLADDLVYVHSSGGADSKTSYLAHLAQGTIRYLILSLSDVALVRAQPGLVVLTGRMNAQVVRGERQIAVSSVYLAVWTQGVAGWQLVAFQGTGVAPA